MQTDERPPMVIFKKKGTGKMKLNKEAVSNYCNTRKAIKQKVEMIIGLWGEVERIPENRKLIDCDILTVEGKREILAKVFNKERDVGGKWNRWHEYYSFPVKYLYLTKPQIRNQFRIDIKSGKMGKAPTVEPFKQ